MKDLLLKLLPDFGPSGFYEWFMRGLVIFFTTFAIGGLNAVSPLVNDFFAQFSFSEAITVSGAITGFIAWVVGWLTTKRNEVTGTVVPTTGEIA